MTLAVAATSAAAQDCPGPGCPAIDPFADLGGFIDTLSARISTPVEGAAGETRGGALVVEEPQEEEQETLEGRLLLDIPFEAESADLSENGGDYVSRVCLGLWLAGVDRVAVTAWPTGGDAALSEERANRVRQAISDSCALEPESVVVREGGGTLPAGSINVASGTLIELNPLE